MRARIILLAGVLLALVGVAMALRSIASDPYWRNTIDFGLYLRSAHELAEGRSAYPPNNPGGLYFGAAVHDGYAYPPPLAWLIAALLPLGDVPARALWTLASAAAFIASFVYLARRRLDLAWHWVALALGVVMFSRTWRVEVYHGQANWILLGLLVAGLVAHQQGKPMRTAVLWSLMIAVKPFTGVLVFWLLWRRHYREGLVCAALGGAIIVASFLPTLGSLSGFEDSMTYYSSPTGAGGRPDNIALHGLWSRLVVETPYAHAWVVAPWLLRPLDALTAAALALLFAVSFPRGSKERPLVEVGAVMLSASLFGPLANGSHLWLTLPGLFGAWALAREDRRWRWAAWAWTALFVFRLAPVRLPFGNAFGSPDGISWVAPGGLGVLVTGLGAAVMLGVLVVMATVRRGDAVLRGAAVRA